MDGSQEVAIADPPKVKVLKKPAETKEPPRDEKPKGKEGDIVEKGGKTGGVEDERERGVEDVRAQDQVRDEIAEEAEEDRKEQVLLAEANEVASRYDRFLDALNENIHNPAVIGGVTAAGLGILNEFLNLPGGTEFVMALGGASAGMAMTKDAGNKARNAVIAATTGAAVAHGVDLKAIGEAVHIKGVTGLVGLVDDVAAPVAVVLRKIWERVRSAGLKK